MVAIAAGYYHSEALTAEGQVFAWGNYRANIGGANVVAIAAGGEHSLPLTADGRVLAGGRVNEGQRDVPEGLSNVVAIAAGEDHSLALTAEGGVVAWGGNQLYGEPLDQPKVPPGLSNVAAIAAGQSHSLALVGSGSPAISVQPFSQTVVPGHPVALTALSVGRGPLAYQWQCNGSNILGAANRTLAFDNVELAHAGDYTAVVSNALGVVTSRVARLTVVAPPTLEPLPASVAAVVGSNVTFTVTATGAPPLRYQWRKNAVNIPGATNSSYTITHVRVRDGGSYSVVVANSAVTRPIQKVTRTVSMADGFIGRWTLPSSAGRAWASSSMRLVRRASRTGL